MSPGTSSDELDRLALRVLLASFPGTDLDDDTCGLLEEGLGGLCLFGSNTAAGPEAVAAYVDRARKASPDVVVAIDEEGGDVTRLHARTGSPFLGAGALGAADDLDLTRVTAAGIGAELAGLGIDMTLAPVADVNSNPDNPVIGIRSFGTDPARVAEHVAAWVDGVQSAGVAACAKHFPGHGDTDVDSHLALPVVEHSRSRLEDVELRPFRMAIDAGVATIMTAHVVVRELDPDVPATLSPAVIAGLLREQMGYEGVIVSDDLEMKAVAAHWPPGDAAVRAMQAGCDILPVCAQADAQVAAIEGVVRAVESDEIRFSDLDAAGERVRALKRRYLLPYRDPDPREARRAAGGEERLMLAREIAAGGGLTA
jgi:beta-N-acetylhexosaminidase